MRILCIGDVVGSIGCEFLRNNLPTLKKVKGVDFVICNGENSADGNGLTPVSAKHLFDSGVDAITLGNHSFRRKEVYDCLDSNPFIVRPANFPENSTPGKGIINVDTGRRIVSIINIMGNSYMDNNLNCAFECVDKMIKQAESKIIIVDFHAEATGEKRAMGYYLDGRVSAMFGTHTHVQTSDAQVLPKGTGYITDTGMTGTIRMTPQKTDPHTEPEKPTKAPLFQIFPSCLMMTPEPVASLFGVCTFCLRVPPLPCPGLPKKPNGSNPACCSRTRWKRCSPTTFSLWLCV